MAALGHRDPFNIQLRLFLGNEAITLEIWISFVVGQLGFPQRDNYTAAMGWAVSRHADGTRKLQRLETHAVDNINNISVGDLSQPMGFHRLDSLDELNAFPPRVTHAGSPTATIFTDAVPGRLGRSFTYALISDGPSAQDIHGNPEDQNLPAFSPSSGTEPNQIPMWYAPSSAPVHKPNPRLREVSYYITARGSLAPILLPAQAPLPTLDDLTQDYF